MRVTERLRRTVEVRGAPIDLTPTEWGLLLALAAADPGQRVELTIIRAGQMHTVPVTLGTLPAT
jgi:hypothetical protein